MTPEQKIFLDTVGDIVLCLDTKGILPSLIIAQAIHESGWGRSGLAAVGNALFGIKATGSWQGAVYNSLTKEYYDGVNAETVPGCFRAYGSWAESVVDYVRFVTGNARYRAVVGETCYKDACASIHAAGYATDPNYGAYLIRLIEANWLTAFDPVPGTVRVRLDGILYRPKADNVDGMWFVNILGLETVRVPLRELLYLAGYGGLTWDEKRRVVSANTI